METILETSTASGQAIDVTPTWAGILPILILGLTEGTEAGQRQAKEELMRMAQAADAYNAQVGQGKQGCSSEAVTR